MNEKAAKSLCLSLIRAETEDEVADLLRKCGLWEDEASWQFYGGYEGNYNTIGNQQSRPEAALVEKIVNSVDARLMNEALMAGLDPEGPHAPQSVRHAVAMFFDTGMRAGDPSAGLVREWPDQKRSEIAKGIAVVATGHMPDEGFPCISIIDVGEGQPPERFPTTFLSLTRSNKLRIPFVQGKYNMGGSGVLKFCGRRNLQLIVSRRCPTIKASPEHEAQGERWGFTVVRREDPSGGRRNSVYTYLAPLPLGASGQRGVLCFRAESLPLFPEGRRPFAREVAWGTLIKLYEYQLSGLKSNILRKGGLLSRLDLMLPQVALPVRLYECRAGYRGHEGSFETTLAGLSVRLDDDKAENLEFTPTSSRLSVADEIFVITIYAFKKGHRETYTRNEGVIFVLNGQTHGHFSADFFRRKSVGMSYLSDSILVIVDCGELTGRAREDLFMTSRDRLSGGDLRESIETALESLIKGHEQLRALRERRRREEIATMTAEDKPLAELLQELLRRTPALADLLLAGGRLSDPFRPTSVDGGNQPFSGRKYPTYFHFAGEDYGSVIDRDCHINMRFRVLFETDAENEYFSRALDRGVFSCFVGSPSKKTRVHDYVLNLANGVASLTVALPPTAHEGDVLRFGTEVTDASRVDPLVNRFAIRVLGTAIPHKGGNGHRQPPSNQKGTKRDAPTQLAMPKVTRVAKADWEKQEPPFDRHTAIRIKHAGTETEDGREKQIYDFYVNIDNIFLRTEQKNNRLDPRLVEARFVYGLVLLALAMIRDDADQEEPEESDSQRGTDGRKEETIEDRVKHFSKAAASVILPIIESLSGLEPGDVEEIEAQAEGS